MSVYAQWEFLLNDIEPIYVDIIFKNYYGVADSAAYLKLVPNLKIVKPVDPVTIDEEWQFKGWCRDSGLTDLWNFDNDLVEDYMIEGDNNLHYIILYPKWQKGVKTTPLKHLIINKHLSPVLQRNLP